MDFGTAERERTRLAGQRTAGAITPAQFAAAVNTLRVTDAQGRIWQPDPAGTGWLVWNGTAWVKGAPPLPGTGDRPKDFNEFKGSLMTVDEFKKMSKDVPLAKRPQRWWDLLSILGGVAGAIIWFIYGGIRSGNEGFDLITPLLMVAIPVGLVWFRADIDQMLLPLQPHRKKISRIILIGLGIATPFLTAWILYNIFHISQYPLMQANIVVGTLAAYVITRDPQVQGARSIGKAPGAMMIIFAAVLVSCFFVPVLADDCTRDPLNAQDCLRTGGYAELIAGLASTILSILINGPIILQTILQSGTSGVTGVQPPTPPVPPGPQGPPGPPVTPTTPAGPVSPTPPVEPPKTAPPEIPKAPPSNQKQIDDIMAQALKDKAAAAAAAQAAAQAAAAKPAVPPGFDPVTGKRILTPEQQARRDFLIQEIAKNSADAAAWSSYANKLDVAVAGLTAVEKGADIAIDIGATLSPVGGARIKNIYAATKTITKDMSQSYADGKGLTQGFKDGVIEAATDKALDLFAGQVTDKFGGKIPGFGKYDTHLDDYGKMGVSDIKDRLGQEFVKETGDIGQDLRHLIQQSDAKKAVSNSLKNAMQGQAQSAGLWDPFKKFLGVSN